MARVQRKKVRVSKLVAKLADEKALGQEPIYSAEMTETEFAKTLNWYNYMYDQDFSKSKEFILTFLQEKKIKSQIIRNIKNYPDIKIPLYVGWICRQISINSIVPNKYRLKAINFLQEIAEQKIINEKNEQETVQVVNIQFRIREKTSEIIGELEGLYDDFIEKFSTNVIPYEWMLANSVTLPIARVIIEYFTPKFEEIKDAYLGKDNQLKEAYSCYSKPQLKKIISFYENVISDAARIINNKAVRKPRKKKVKSISSQISKVSYKKEDTEYKIKSIDPTNIIGATSLWTFNTKYRILTVYNCIDPKGFVVKGTTIQNFDEATSISKKLRKPETVLNDILTGTKAFLKKVMNSIKTQESKTTGRLNNETIILRSLK